MKPREAIENAERMAEETGARQFVQRTAILVAILAAILTIITLMSERAETEALLAQTRANDNSTKYQTALQLEHLDLDIASMLRAFHANGLGGKGLLLKEAGRLDHQVTTKHFRNKLKLSGKVRNEEHERDVQLKRHHALQYGQGALEVAVVLTTIAAVLRARWMVIAGLALGVLGVLITFDAYLSISGISF